MRILFISKGGESASTRYRALQFFPLLDAAGFAPKHTKAAGSVVSYVDALAMAVSSDIVVVLRKTFPLPFLFLLRKASRRLVFDFDDSIFCNSDGSSSKTRMRRFAAMASACDHIFAGNRFLAEVAGRFSSNVTVIPTCIDPARYAGVYDKPAGHMDLVWIGARTTRKYLVEGLPALRFAASKVPHLRLKIVADFDLPESGVPTWAVPWTEAGEAEALGSGHIGIAPMHDDDWSRGKCALKVLQYMAAGLPVVSSATGANAEIIRTGENGFLAADVNAWAKHIVTLAVDPSLRQRLGDAGRRDVLESYSVEPVFARIREVLVSLSR